MPCDSRDEVHSNIASELQGSAKAWTRKTQKLNFLKQGCKRTYLSGQMAIIVYRAEDSRK